MMLDEKLHERRPRHDRLLARSRCFVLTTHQVWRLEVGMRWGRVRHYLSEKSETGDPRHPDKRASSKGRDQLDLRSKAQWLNGSMAQCG